MHEKKYQHADEYLSGGTGVIAFELRRQYPDMDVSVFEMEKVVKLAKERFVPGNEHLNVKFVAGCLSNFFFDIFTLLSFPLTKGKTTEIPAKSPTKYTQDQFMHTGDFFKTPFPNVDLFIICRVLRNMSPKELDDLISKCFSALNPGSFDLCVCLLVSLKSSCNPCILIECNVNNKNGTKMPPFHTGGALLAFEQMQNESRDGSISATLWDVINMSWDTAIPTPTEYNALFSKHGFKDLQFTFTQDWNEYDIILAKK